MAAARSRFRKQYSSLRPGLQHQGFHALVALAGRVTVNLGHVDLDPALAEHDPHARQLHLGRLFAGPQGLFGLDDLIPAAEVALFGVVRKERAVGRGIGLEPGGTPVFHKVGHAGSDGFKVGRFKAEILRQPFHAHNAQFAVLIRLPVQPPDAFGGDVGSPVILLEPGDPVIRSLEHMNVAVDDVNPGQHAEQPFLLGLEGREGLALGLGIGFGIVQGEHFGRTPGPGAVPAPGFVLQQTGDGAFGPG